MKNFEELKRILEDWGVKNKEEVYAELTKKLDKFDIGRIDGFVLRMVALPEDGEKIYISYQVGKNTFARKSEVEIRESKKRERFWLNDWVKLTPEKLDEVTRESRDSYSMKGADSASPIKKVEWRVEVADGRETKEKLSYALHGVPVYSITSSEIKRATEEEVERTRISSKVSY